MPISIDKEVAESGQLPACWKAREALIDCLMQSACIRKVDTRFLIRTIRTLKSYNFH